MNQLLAGSTLIALGSVMLMMYNVAIRSQKENSAFQTPYMKNGGMGLILFGLYFLAKYIMANT